MNEIKKYQCLFGGRIYHEFKRIRKIFSPQFSKSILWLACKSCYMVASSSITRHSAPKDAADDRPRGAAATGICRGGEILAFGRSYGCRVKVWNMLAMLNLQKKHNMFVRGRFQLMGSPNFWLCHDSFSYLHSSDSFAFDFFSIPFTFSTCRLAIVNFNFRWKLEPINGSMGILHLAP